MKRVAAPDHDNPLFSITNVKHLLLIIAIATCFGCGDDSPPPDECEFPTITGPDNREVVIGTLRSGPEPIGERFTAWEDGSDQNIIFGFQGGYMVQPTVRVSALPDDPPGICASVLIENTADIARVDSGMEVARELIPVGGFLWAGPFDNLLAFDLDDVRDLEVTVSVTVSSELFRSSDSAMFTAILE